MSNGTGQAGRWMLGLGVVLAVVAAWLVLRGTLFQMQPACDRTVHIRSGQGAQGAVPGTTSAKRNMVICWVNEDTIEHRVVFTDSPGKHPKAPETLVVPPNGGKKWIRVHGRKPNQRAYEYDIQPPAHTGGGWPPAEPQVIVE